MNKLETKTGIKKNNHKMEVGMKRNWLSFLLLVGVLGMFVAGCKTEDPVGPVQDPEDQLYGAAQTDQQFFQLYAENSEFFRTDDITLNDGEQPEPLDDFSLGKESLTPIRPLRWGRFIRSVNRTVTVDSITVDSLAYITVTKTLQGTFIIAATYSDSSTVPDTVIRKPFTSVAKKRFIFKRVGADRIIHRNWKPVAVSLNEGGTVSSSNIDIASLKLLFERNGQADSIVVTDPLSTFLRFRQIREVGGHEIPDLVASRPVVLSVTLTSNDTAPDHVIVRYGYSLDRMHRRRIRLQMVSESFDPGTQLYTRVFARRFEMHFKRGVFSATVDAMTHGTLFEDDDPVATSFWGIPYMVTR